jgi:hypothetical protein
MVRDDERASDDGDVPIAELSDVRRVAPPRARSPKSRRVAAAFLAVAVVAGGAAIGVRISGNDDGHGNGAPKPGVAVRNIDDPRARIDVYSALRVTTASGSFHIRYRLSETPAPASSTTSTPAGSSCESVSNAVKIAGGHGVIIDCGYAAAPHNVAISGDGVVTVNPTAMVTRANVPNLGLITTRVNGTDVWEEGGGNYGMIPGSGTGAGAPLSEFAGLVLGTLGQREGAVAMGNMASPTGYLDLAEQSITATSSLGDSEVDDVPTHDYKVTIDSNRDHRPGLTAEEAKTAAAARAVLAREGYTSTVVRLSIDGLGFIRRAQTTVTFSDRGTVDADTTFSDFGCATVAIGPAGPTIEPDPAGCRSPADANTSTTAPTVSPAPVPSTERPGPATTTGPSPTPTAVATTAPTTTTAVTPDPGPATTAGAGPASPAVNTTVPSG